MALNQMPNTTPKPKSNLWLIATIVLAVVLVVGSIVFAWQKSASNKVKSDLQGQINTLQSQVRQLTKVASTDKTTSIIEGSLSYPSEGIPPNLKTCAENITTKQNYCTTQQIKDKKFQYGIGYRLEVPIGEYNVYSQVGTEYKAYYSEFVTCGLKQDCPSHKSIKVTVTAGQVTTQINPGDWYVAL